MVIIIFLRGSSTEAVRWEVIQAPNRRVRDEIVIVMGSGMVGVLRLTVTSSTGAFLNCSRVKVRKECKSDFRRLQIHSTKIWQ